MRAASEATAAHIGRENAFGAHNYAPLPVVLARGARARWVTDVEGRRYLDLMSAYSAVSFGHYVSAHRGGTLVEQAQRLAVTSRAYFNDRLPAADGAAHAPHRLSTACCPSSGGAEAVETALKAARKWGHKGRASAEGRAEIIACAGELPRAHDRDHRPVHRSRSTATASARTRRGFFTVPLRRRRRWSAAITPNTAAFLVESVQGEAGIVVLPDGYLADCAAICRRYVACC